MLWAYTADNSPSMAAGWCGNMDRWETHEGSAQAAQQRSLQIFWNPLLFRLGKDNVKWTVRWFLPSPCFTCFHTLALGIMPKARKQNETTWVIWRNLNLRSSINIFSKIIEGHCTAQPVFLLKTNRHRFPLNYLYGGLRAYSAVETVGKQVRYFHEICCGTQKMAI